MIRYKISSKSIIKSRIKELRKKFPDQFTKRNRDNRLIKVIEDIIDCQEPKENKKLIRIIRNLHNKISDKEAEDLDIINYNEWLKGIIK